MHAHEGTMNPNSIALIGHPNVGKSVIFQKLTGIRTTVSNFPGTTVGIISGQLSSDPRRSLIDTPGVGSWPPQSDDERLAAKILLEGNLSSVVQVGDAKNLGRTLALTVVLIELGMPLTLALNMMDEAESNGLRIDHEALSKRLAIPVATTTATQNRGIGQLNQNLADVHPGKIHVPYPAHIERGVKHLIPLLPESAFAARGMALLFLSRMKEADQIMRRSLSQDVWTEMTNIRDELDMEGGESTPVQIQLARWEFAERLALETTFTSWAEAGGAAARLGELAIHPVWGLPILALVMAGLYWFVGIFGAQTLVGLFEEDLFGKVLNPWVSHLVHQLISIPILQQFLVGEYGIWTMGFTYAAALIFPIVTTFFLAFSVIEDSGYLPRLATLSNRFFLKMGLNGKAVLPMVLGLGCVTMATLTTRTLDSRRERLMVTLLLALAIPCSAQLGIVLGMLASISLQAVLIWVSFILVVLFSVGKLANRVTPGERQGFIVELAPIRVPQLSNVVTKTISRLEWYLKEVLPIFLIGAALMFVLDQTGALAWLIQWGRPLMTGWLALPPEATSAFVLGFLRRDFGATGLFVMSSTGMLTASQVLVAMITITLFVPCIASVFMIAKEYSWRTAAAMTALVIPTALLAGGVARMALELVGFG